MNHVISLQGVSRVYGKRDAPVLKNVFLDISAGEVAAIVGPSGSGKSTMLQIMGLLDAPTSGSVSFMGELVNYKNENKITKLRGSEVGFVYQFHHLLPNFSAKENVMLPQMAIGGSRSEAAKQALSLLNRMGLGALSDRRPSELSGGERQRVAICRALANSPKLLIADEPTGNLDVDNSRKIFALINELAHEQNMAVVFATHYLSLAERSHRKISINSLSEQG